MAGGSNILQARTPLRPVFPSMPRLPMPIKDVEGSSMVRSTKSCIAAFAMFAFLLFSAPSSLAQDDDWRCSKAELEDATEWSGSGIRQASANTPERLVLSPDSGMFDFDAGDGDDVLYLVDPPGGQSVTSGSGADTVVVCRMTDLTLHVLLGDETTGGADLEDDRLILNAAVFQGIPDGFVRQVFVYGISPQNDRIELRLPPGVEFHYGIDHSTAGNVVLSVHPGNPDDRIGEHVFDIVREDDAPAAHTSDVPPALSAYDAGRTCDDIGDETFAKGREDLSYLNYTQGRDVVTTARVPGEHIHHTWDGDDLVYVESSQMLATGRGADQVVVCSLDEPMTAISLGPGGAVMDFDPDTLVVEAARLQDGVKRELEVQGLSPVNDRIVLRLPEGLEPSIEVREYAAAEVKLGDLTLVVGPSNWLGGADSHRGMFVVETVAPVEMATAKPGELPDLSTVTCPDPDAPGAFAEGRIKPDYSVGVEYSTQSERILVRGTAGLEYYDAMDGDDRIFVFEPLDGTMVQAGRDSDVVTVCAMASLSLNIELGDTDHTADSAPDAVILEPSVFLGVPEGVRRRIGIFGAVLTNDRIVFRLPPGMTPKKLHDTGYGTVEVAVGDVLVTIYRVDDWMNTELPPDAIQVLHAPVPEGLVETPDLPPPNTAAFAHRCPQPGEGGFATPSDVHRTDDSTRIFGTGPDRILVAGEPGWLDYNAWDGDDVVFVTDSIANQHIHLGRGADTAVVCSTNEVSLTINLGPHDADPDTLVLTPGAFLGVPEGYTRRYFVSGIVEGNDRIVLDLPPGMHANITQPSVANMLEATVGRTTITAMTTGDAFGRRGDPGIFVMAGGASGPAPKEQDDRQAPAARDLSASAKWSFDPSVGQARVTGEYGSRLEIGCGDSGPSLAIVPDPRPNGATGVGEHVAFNLIVDGNWFGQDFLCAPEGNCSAIGVPPAPVISALRSGSRLTLSLTLRNTTRDMESYTLKGSNAAISRLAACLN
jgi:hypothetical protein